MQYLVKNIHYMGDFCIFIHKKRTAAPESVAVARETNVRDICAAMHFRMQQFFFLIPNFIQYTVGNDGGIRFKHLPPYRQHRARRYRQLVDPEREEGFGKRQIRSQLAAYSYPRSVFVGVLHRDVY